MTDTPKKRVFGVDAKRREWRDDEVLAAKAFIIEESPDLWEQLKTVQKEGRDFTDLEITRQAKALIYRFNPNWEGVENVDLWGALREKMARELSAGKAEKD